MQFFVFLSQLFKNRGLFNQKMPKIQKTKTYQFYIRKTISFFFFSSVISASTKAVHSEKFCSYFEKFCSLFEKNCSLLNSKCVKRACFGYVGIKYSKLRYLEIIVNQKSDSTCKYVDDFRVVVISYKILKKSKIPHCVEL